MLKKTLILSLILACANAEISLPEINSKPSGRMKNFMIWQFFNQNITPQEADKAYAQVDGKSTYLLNTYLKKSITPAIKWSMDCQNSKDLLSIKDKNCLELALDPYKTLAMTNQQRIELSKRLDPQHPMLNLLKIQSEPYSLKSYESYDPNTILTMFVSTTQYHRQNNLNLDLDSKFINALSTPQTSNLKLFSFIKIVINDDRLDKLQKSLFKLNGEYSDATNNFLLGLYHLKHSRLEDAIEHFELSKLKATEQREMDKATFWIYQATKDKKYLTQLLSSSSINIYTLYASELLNKDVNNYFTSVKFVENENIKNMQDPFDWSDILNEITLTPKEKLFELAQKYNQKNMIPVQSYILEKAYEYKKHSYIMPYDEYLTDISNDDKAFVYAIMKQESNLIPAALSPSFALGLMQIMPFVTNDLSKKVKNPIASYNDMFTPAYNIEYALEHLQWMKKSLYHPLFMAYAYNGGMGFLKKHLESGAFSQGAYEPFLSMELMLNSESREYGKRVLANYVIYKKILGENISIVHLFDMLTQPQKTDRFRVEG
ncbi:MAG: lytic transglycosylase domain-containing protein [Campylobacterales bacterium]|nr:lytic transglycosylase domain-containing protein [Campylobacterales bacterium]